MLQTTLTDLAGEVDRFGALMLGADSFTERLLRTGRVAKDAAQALGAVGVTARASGLALDSRRDHPSGGYRAFEITPVVQHGGDVYARLRVRLDEIAQSLGLIQTVIENLPTGPIASSVGQLPGNAQAFGWTESPRGENLHWVRTGPDGAIARYRARSASFCNWPLVALAVPDNLVPDFPLINKSFELCYACLDR
jgi:Ni,Fe-hydrogenase III large subunit